MSRSARLFDLLQALRRHRAPVSGQALADELGVSIRTLYRDIATLQAQGAEISGEAGVGYVLKPGFLLPPLMFPVEELEALVLGMRWVADRADPRLASSAANALARISAVLPPGLREELDESALHIGAVLLDGPKAQQHPDAIDASVLRKAIRHEHKLRLTYRDSANSTSQRTVWPFALAFFNQSRVLMCWCELRGDFRNFRSDRIERAELLEARYPRHKRALLQEWRVKFEAKDT